MEKYKLMALAVVMATAVATFSCGGGAPATGTQAQADSTAKSAADQTAADKTSQQAPTQAPATKAPAAGTPAAKTKAPAKTPAAESAQNRAPTAGSADETAAKAPAGEDAPAAEATAGDENPETKAVRAFVSAYVESFNKHDAETLAAMWTADARHVDRETGAQTTGREAIQADLAAAFEDNPDTRLSGSVEQVRFIQPDVVSVEGQTLVGAPYEQPASSQFSAILVNEDGHWLIDSIEERPVPAPATAYDALRGLEWLVGNWVDESDEARVDTTVRFSDEQAFLIRSFVTRTSEGVAHQGTQIIGWDPRSQEIRSWTFNSDGSFGDGTWSKSGDNWLVKSSQTLADGQAASGTYVITRLDDDRISVQLIGHEIDGEPQPASERVVVTRAAEAEQPAAEQPADQPGEKPAALSEQESGQ